MSICCADIPRLQGLESIIFRAGLTGGQRIVRWPYVAENDSITPWVSGGELVFVTGINHNRDEKNLCQLVLEAVKTHVAGLVILTGPEFIKEVPRSVLSLANEHGVPVFEQPYNLKMVIVTEVISNAIVQDNLLGKSVHLFLTRLINGLEHAPELIHLRAGELGISDQKSFVTLAIHISEQESDQRAFHLHNELSKELGDLLKRRDIDWPVLNYEKELLVIWPTDKGHTPDLFTDLEQMLAVLQKRFPSLTLSVGVSDCHSGLVKLATATDQARQALRFAVKHQHQKIFFYEQLGIAQLFAAMPNRSLLAAFCKQHLGDLCFARDAATLEMKETLTQYFNNFGHQQQTADAMGIHRNTLSYRLGRIEQRLGYSLHDPFLRLNLQNALLIEQILFHNHHLDEQSKKSPSQPRGISNENH